MKCTSCGRIAPDSSGLCHVCRIERDEGPEAAREYLASLGRKGAEASKAGNAKPAVLEPDELPELETHADAKARLDLISRAVLTGRINDRVANAAIRAVAEWIKGLESELTSGKFQDLQDEVERLKAELGGRPKLRAT